jgi:DNA-binding protein HU-beta
MNKAELTRTIAEKANVTKKQAEDMLDTFVDTVTKTLQRGGEVTIAGFGAFSAKQRAGRTGVNPQNPSEKIQIPPVTVPKFKAGKSLKDALKKGPVEPEAEEAPTTPSAEPEPPTPTPMA